MTKQNEPTSGYKSAIDGQKEPGAQGFFAKSLYSKQYPYKTFINSGIILYRSNSE